MSKPESSPRLWVNPDRLARLILPWVFLALAFVYYETAALSTRWSWSACRLAPAIGMFHGYPLYPAPDTGVINGWLYGPVTAVAWAPAALAYSPSTALAMASVISLLFVLVPLLLAARRGSAQPKWTSASLLAFVAGAGSLPLVYSTWYMTSALNADAVTVGLGAGACLLLSGDKTPNSKWRLTLAALLSVLAAWSKQIEAPLVLAQLGWLWFVHGRKTALSFALSYVGVLAVVSAVIILATGFQPLIFNLWTIPSHQPLIGGWPAAWTEVAAFFRYSAVFWAPVLIVLLWGSDFRPGEKSSASASTRADPLLLWMAAALVLLPAGVAARIKIGGDQNSIHSVYYLAVAATLAVARAWDTGHRYARVRQAILLLLMVTVPVLAVRYVVSYPLRSILPVRGLSEQDWRAARQKPGEFYFPWDPLATLMAEGKMYHFEYGVLDRIAAGVEPTAEQIHRHLPPQPRFVVYPYADGQQTMLARYLPEFAFAGATQGWYIYCPRPKK